MSISPRGIVFGCLLGVAASSALAEEWPSRPIRWIVPFSPGGSNDITARSVAERLTPVLGQPVVVENRPGAAGVIGVEFAAKSPPDGYTVLSSSDTLVAAPHLYSKLGFQPLKDFVAVTQLARQPVVLAAHPSLGVNSVAELVALAKTKPGLAYATSGAGTQQHIAAEWFASVAGIKLTHVPYKGGGQAITDFIGGQVPLAWLGAAPLVPFHRSGRVKLLAQTTHTRSPYLPEVPTLQEVGFKDLVIEQWQGVFVPANTPKEVVVRLHAEIVKALAEPRIVERFAQHGLEVVGNTSEQFAAVVRSDYEKYGRLVRELHIRLD